MTMITDPTAFDGQAPSSQEVELEDLTMRQQVAELQEKSAAAELEGGEQAVELQARVAQLEAHAALRATTHPVKRLVRGRYRSASAGTQLELRVDVDGLRPTMRVSGDFFQNSGATSSYTGSFVVEAPTIRQAPGIVKLEGQGRFSSPTSSRHVRVTIPRGTGVPPTPGIATVEFSAGPGTAPTATHLCSFVSPHFRSVQLEQDSVAGTVPFISYDTGSLPQPVTSPPRTLTVPKAFAEAGIEMQVAGAPNIVPFQEAGPDAKWDESELHNAMVNHFSLWKDAPLWRVWTLVATAFVDSRVRGIMFDGAGAFQRQGCAVFHDKIKGTDPASQRAQLRTYVHELGHAFNLYHSWLKDQVSPPQPLGPNGGMGDLSWMNYAQGYKPLPPAPGGEAAYWAAFPFQFTDNELVHLRHGFYRDVVMGGNRFGVGASETEADLFGDPVVNNSGLALELRSPSAFRFGQPVVVELKLSTTDLNGRSTHGYLNPEEGFVTIAICTPSGVVKTYRPPMTRCVDDAEQVRLDSERPAIYKSTYIGYGKDGLYFQQPGRYQLRAQYVASDGSRVLSQIHHLTVRSPLTDEDENVAELMMGDDQGMLFHLLGSHSETLSSGRDALDEMLDRYADHPLAVYPHLVKGANASRDFKYLPATGKPFVMAAAYQESIDQLNKVVTASVENHGVDNITLGWVMKRRARMEARAGRVEQARQTADDMVSILSERTHNPSVRRDIKSQAQRLRDTLPGERG
ncbi:hypothetical protein AR457_01960 [Streptomyces agglomeratus]|uniref:Uncharacterized protein n=1 Tax=Streptomyces agglomeratus TaxID=285458 RepID=A0A1E5P1N0_9ACTN|nr:hypothetical protein [Streptomyces agglomeratus]OEJ23451.1 hypothetical protein AS594_02065 [Streptomyces agglomeratus]OEJ43044.1 hypothetical protein AR457_01960 [Streptomyces agglomeratus]OEJ55040.1 hypothetical protein BGK72_33825 [Streptomyces agglomeratus]OEJ56257.1 hypothetical protein BGM19_39050 [Streptomyces agglomeratus]OEJ62404.1 hypothetical protein BGM19_34760 [Streptomyces agglomeratus]